MIILFLSLCFGSTMLDYEKELEEKAMLQILKLLEKQEHTEIRNVLQAFEKELFPSDRLYYDIGLAYNQQGKIDYAKKYYDRALEINPNQSAALYDRAELYLLDGNIVKAKTDLECLVSQKHEHWAVYFRLAEIAAKEKDGQQLENYLLRAIRHDLDLKLLLKDPLTWQTIAKDPTLRPYLHRIFVVMAEEKLWDTLVLE